MKTFFVNYLKHLQETLVDDQVTTAVIDTAGQDKKTPKINFCLVNSRDVVKRALEEDAFSPLSRILNEFPISGEPYPYHYATLAGFIGQPRNFKSHVDRYHDILMQGGQIIFDDRANSLKPLSHAKLNEIKNFVSDLMLIACEEILDGSGQVRGKIIQILGLQPLMEAWRNKKDLEPLLHAQLISAYFTQILWGAIVKVWNETRAEAYTQSQRDPKAPANLSLFINNQLLGKGTNADFLKKIRDFPIYGRQIEQSCAMILSVMPVEEIVKIMTADCRPLTAAQLALMPVHLQRSWQDAKISFWVETIKYVNEYLLQHLAIDREDTERNAEQDKQEVLFIGDEIQARLAGVVGDDHSYRAALADFFPAKIAQREQIFNNSLSYLHQTCESISMKLNATLALLRKCSDKKSLSLFSSKPAYPKLEKEPFITPVLALWFTVRDNNTIIQAIIRDVEERKLGIVFRNLVGDVAADFVEETGPYLRLTTKEAQVLAELDQCRFKYDYSISEPIYLLQTFITLCPEGSLQELLISYKDALLKPPEEDIVNYYQRRV
jgi:hypothetical protein